MKAYFSWEPCSNKQSENCMYPAKRFPLWNLISLSAPLHISLYFYALKNYKLNPLLYSGTEVHGISKLLLFTV